MCVCMWVWVCMCIYVCVCSHSFLSTTTGSIIHIHTRTHLCNDKSALNYDRRGGCGFQFPDHTQQSVDINKKSLGTRGMSSFFRLHSTKEWLYCSIWRAPPFPPLLESSSHQSWNQVMRMWRTALVEVCLSHIHTPPSSTVMFLNSLAWKPTSQWEIAQHFQLHVSMILLLFQFFGKGLSSWLPSEVHIPVAESCCCFYVICYVHVCSVYV